MNTDDKKVIDLLRTLSIDMITKAKSGHPGVALSAAPILYTLYSRHMCINTNDEKWLDRDRFVLSCGHASSLLYACLFLAGYNISLEDLKNFRTINSKTPGHVEYGVTPGVDVTTGALGQGFATSVGLALAEAHLASRYNPKKKGMIDKTTPEIFNHYTYVLCSDGDLMEGISYEAASLAGTLKLGKLIVLYDSNNITLDGKTSDTFTENVLKRFEALNWHTQLVSNGEDVNQIDKAIVKAQMVTDRPSIIEVKTVIGKYSKYEGTSLAHGTVLTDEEVTEFKQKLGARNVSFAVSEEATNIFRSQIYSRSNKKYKKWAEDYSMYIDTSPTITKMEVESLMTRGLKYDILSMFKEYFPSDYKQSLRDTQGDILKNIANNMPFMIGGSADVASSTKTYIENLGIISPLKYENRNIMYGVREQAMGAISNGLALCGLRPFASCYLSFSDLVKPSIRYSSLMNLPVVYIFTNDSILIGEDGPTHQPVEHLAALRSIPNLDVYRPSDANEIVGCWDLILKNTRKPSALIISKEEIGIISTSSSYDVRFGAYIIKKEQQHLDGILIATGSEVTTALKLQSRLFERNLDIRVVSMPNVDLFKKQTKEYKESILPIGIKTIVIEFLSGFGLSEFVYSDKYLITMDSFGKSGRKEDVLKEFKLDFMSIENRIYDLLK